MCQGAVSIRRRPDTGVHQGASKVHARRLGAATRDRCGGWCSRSGLGRIAASQASRASTATPSAPAPRAVAGSRCREWLDIVVGVHASDGNIETFSSAICQRSGCLATCQSRRREIAASGGSLTAIRSHHSHRSEAARLEKSPYASVSEQAVCQPVLGSPGLVLRSERHGGRIIRPRTDRTGDLLVRR